MLKFFVLVFEIKYFTSANDTYCWLPEDVEYSARSDTFQKGATSKIHLTKDPIMRTPFIPFRCGSEVAFVFRM